MKILKDDIDRVTSRLNVLCTSTCKLVSQLTQFGANTCYSGVVSGERS